MSPERLPGKLERRFALYAQPLVETYRALGIEAEFRPVNDIHVRGRKIGGTGAAAIGEAEVLVGSLMFDFDTERMSRVLKVPSEKFRDKVHQSLQSYMTTMRRELGEPPDREKVKTIYLERCSEALGEALEPGQLTDAEREAVEALDARFASEEWLRQKGGSPRAGVKIHQDVWVAESLFKAPGGLIRLTACLRDDRIEDLSISGDFTFHPQGRLAELERALVGVALEPESLAAALAGFYGESGVETPGVGVADWQEALLRLKASR
jgi:lipoate-protein ligase A